jgi:glycosyltransferase involved in cell wall biosynthesis
VIDKPLVSVIIPFFNVERFIEEAIVSVLAQTHRAWELFLIDDGSTDKSSDVARRYAGKHPDKIFYLDHADHANKGKSASRNRGLLEASGKYVAFLDADDVWLSTILEEQVAILESRPQAAMVYGPIQWWYSWTGDREDLSRDCVEELGVPPNAVIHPPGLLTLFLQDRAAVPSDILVRREIIDRVGGFEERFRTLYEDQVFYAKVCLAAQVFAADTCWYRYRQHEDSTCARAMITGEYFSARPVFLHWLERYLTDQGVEDSALWQALDREQWPYRHPATYRLLRRVTTREGITERIVRVEAALRRMRHVGAGVRGGSAYGSRGRGAGDRAEQ